MRRHASAPTASSFHEVAPVFAFTVFATWKSARATARVPPFGKATCAVAATFGTAPGVGGCASSTETVTLFGDGATLWLTGELTKLRVAADWICFMSLRVISEPALGFGAAAAAGAPGGAAHALDSRHVAVMATQT